MSANVLSEDEIIQALHQKFGPMIETPGYIVHLYEDRASNLYLVQEGRGEAFLVPAIGRALASFENLAREIPPLTPRQIALMDEDAVYSVVGVVSFATRVATWWSCDDWLDITRGPDGAMLASETALLFLGVRDE